jgi:dihydrofolate synthase/folylpolyglutamate synthase
VSWTLDHAEEHLLSLELFGMKFGLERMRRLLTALESPQRAFRAVHVVGTNGKSSTVRMTAGILQAHGLRTGAYLSPHLTSFAERVRIDGEDLEPAAFAAAVQRAAAAAAKVDRGLEGGERVTQFELLTAAALDALARAGVEVAVIEAGLGGRHDATNVLDAEVVVLTNVGLEHTRWLGPTVPDIAREKLAVLKPGAKLVVGDVDAETMAEARAAAGAAGSRLTVAATRAAITAGGEHLAGYQRANFAVAQAAAAALIGPLREDALDAAAAAVTVPGRLQVVDADPLTIVDGAHNPDGMNALVDALGEVVQGRPVVAAVSVLDDKDAAAMLRSLLPHCEAAVFCAAPSPRALPPATLASLAGQVAPGVATELADSPRAAVGRARELAGPDGAVVATGSIYLVADLLSAPGTRRASAL